MSAGAGTGPNRSTAILWVPKFFEFSRQNLPFANWTFPGRTFPGRTFPGRVFPGRTFAGQTFAGRTFFATSYKFC